MNEIKKVKKLLRNLKNKIRITLIEDDPWGGGRVIAVTENYSNLKIHEKVWKQKFKEKYGCESHEVFDAPSLSFYLSVRDQLGNTVYEKKCWSKKEIEDLLEES